MTEHAYTVDQRDKARAWLTDLARREPDVIGGPSWCARVLLAERDALWEANRELRRTAGAVPDTLREQVTDYLGVDPDATDDEIMARIGYLRGCEAAAGAVPDTAPADDLREQLAEIEHRRWSDWQRYQHSLCERLEDGSLRIPAEKVAHWERQIGTPYAELSEREKASDREQVDRYWHLVQPHTHHTPPPPADELAGLTADQLRWRLIQQREHSARLVQRVRLLEDKLVRSHKVIAAALELESAFRAGRTDVVVRAQDAVMDAARALAGEPAGAVPDTGPPAAEPLTEEQRDAIYDLLPLTTATIWADDEELNDFPWTLAKWMEAIGHPKAHTACCGTCGCAITCMGGAFFDATVSTVLRELSRLGLLRPAASASPSGDTPNPEEPR